MALTLLVGRAVALLPPSQFLWPALVWLVGRGRGRRSAHFCRRRHWDPGLCAALRAAHCFRSLLSALSFRSPLADKELRCRTGATASLDVELVHAFLSGVITAVSAKAHSTSFCDVKTPVTMPTEINSNDFGRFGNDSADSNSKFVVVEIFKKPIRFFVCSGFNHIQCDCTCACVVACLHPSHFLSNCGCVLADS